MARLAKIRHLTWSERGCLCAALVMLPLTALTLRVASLSRIQSILNGLGPMASHAAANGDTAMKATQLARIVSAAAHYGPYGATCLPRALTLGWLLRRQGIKSDLRLGVAKNDGTFEAHAWVEYEGVPLPDGPDVYLRFSAFEASDISRAN